MWGWKLLEREGCGGEGFLGRMSIVRVESSEEEILSYRRGTGHEMIARVSRDLIKFGSSGCGIGWLGDRGSVETR